MSITHITQLEQKIARTVQASFVFLLFAATTVHSQVIHSTQRALPSMADAAIQDAHYQHVYVDSSTEAATTLKTIPLADAVQNNILASSDEPVQRLQLDPKKLVWVVLDGKTVSPVVIEGVGGHGIDSDNFAEVNFHLNEVQITNPDHLDGLISKAKKVNGIFYIVGYADESGLESKNLLLSENRSKSVSDYLIAHGIAPDRIQHNGAGVSRLHPGLDPNRRASVSFLIRD